MASVPASVRTAATVAAVAAAVAAALALRPRPPSLGVTPDEAVAAWNAAADAELDIGRLEWTDPDSGTFGFAFTPTVSVLGRVTGPLGEVSELVVVGGRADAPLLAEAGDVLLGVALPAAGPDERAAILDRLGLGGGYRPARPAGSVTVDGVTLRATSTADRWGLGAKPAGG